MRLLLQVIHLIVLSERNHNSDALYWNRQLVCTLALGVYLCVSAVTSNVELRNYVITRQIVIERRVT